MNEEQERLVITTEEVAPAVPETRQPSRVRQVSSAAHRTAGTTIDAAKVAWRSPARQQASRRVRRGAATGLRWFGRQLTALADRVTPTKRPPTV